MELQNLRKVRSYFVYIKKEWVSNQNPTKHKIFTSKKHCINFIMNNLSIFEK